jgi:hypothetical protein
MSFAVMLLAFVAAPRAAIVYEAGVTAAPALAARLGPAWRVSPAAPPAAADVRAYTEGAAALAAGRKAYDGMLFEEAVPKLRRAVELLQSASLEAGQWPALWSARLWLALTCDALGDEVNRDAELDKLWLLDPGLDVAGAEFPPAFRDRVRKRLAQRPVKSGRLRIESDPAGADVFVNGRRRGATPLIVEGLPDGEHAVGITQTGRLPWQRRVTVRAGFGVGAEATPDLVEARLAPAAGAAAERILARLRAGEPIPEADRAAAARDLTPAGAQAGVFAARAGEAVQVLVVQPDGSSRGPARVADSDALAAQAAEWLDQAAKVRGQTSDAAPHRQGRPTRWWLWTTLGAMVAGGATAAAIAVADNPAPDRRSGEAVVRW